MYTHLYIHITKILACSSSQELIFFLILLKYKKNTFINYCEGWIAWRATQLQTTAFS